MADKPSSLALTEAGVADALQLAAHVQAIEGKLLAAGGVGFSTTLGWDQAALLMRLVESGLYGSTRAEVIRELILAGVRRAVSEGIVELPGAVRQLEGAVSNG